MLQVFMSFPDINKLDDQIGFAIGDKRSGKTYGASFMFRQGMSAIEFSHHMKEIISQIDRVLDNPELLNSEDPHSIGG